MNARSTATHLTILLVGMALGLGSVAVAQNQLGARGSSDAQIGKALKDMNRKLDVVNKNLGGDAGTPAAMSIGDKLTLMNVDIGGSADTRTNESLREGIRRVCAMLTQNDYQC